MVIAVGGRGQRISDYFKKIKYRGPKVLYPIANQPLLYYLIAMAKQANVRSVVLLGWPEHNRSAARTRAYWKSRGVSIHFGKYTPNMSLPARLRAATMKWTKPFLYCDGNVLLSPDLFTKLIIHGLPSDKSVLLVTNRHKEADTHLQLMFSQGKVISVGTAKGVNQIKSSRRTKLQHMWSPGCMIIRPQLLRQYTAQNIPSDLDEVNEDLFSSDPKSLQVYRYRGNWWSLHNQKDLDKITKKPYSGLFALYDL